MTSGPAERSSGGAPMQVAVIGAGVTGLVAAYRLSAAGNRCHVYERWPGLGGQAATLDVGGHQLERYYHHLFTSDVHIAELYRELGLADEVEWRRSSIGMFADGASHPFTSPLDLLRFRPMSPLARVRMGLAVVLLQRFARDVAPFERQTTRAWVERWMGREAYAKVWGPLLRGKFADRGDEISMAWLWGKLMLRRQMKGREAREERLGYPRGSFETLFQALRSAIERGGGSVLIDRPALRVERGRERGFSVTPAAAGSFRRGHRLAQYDPGGEPVEYDAVIATVPSDVFLDLLEPELATSVGDEYLAKLRSVEYQTALCMLLEIDRRFSPFYWTNIADRTLPFIGLVEHTNFVEPERYDGRRFLYIANYLEQGHPLLSLDADELLAAYGPGLRRVNRDFSPEWVRAKWLFREPAAQPVVTVGYERQIPALETGVPGLVLANTTQIYPEDRGTNYSVRLGGEAAAAAMASVQAGPAKPDPGPSPEASFPATLGFPDPATLGFPDPAPRQRR